MQSTQLKVYVDAKSNAKMKDIFVFDQNKQMVSNKSGLIPATISSVDYRNDYCPTPQIGQRGLRILNRLKTYSNVFPKPYQGY